MERCLYCYKELADGERDFHKSCSKKIFGTPQVPLLPYTRANIAELAREVIRSQTTLTGVQAKFRLQVHLQCSQQDVHSNRFVTLSDIRRTMLRSVLHMQVFPLVKMVLPISATKISLL